MSRTIFLVIITFLGSWIVFPAVALGAMSIACNGVTTGRAGVCSEILDCDATIEEAATRMTNAGPVAVCLGSQICCIPLAASDGPPTGNACTDGGGRCARTADGCFAGEVPASRGGCSIGQMCCDPSGGTENECTIVPGARCATITEGCTTGETPASRGGCSSGRMCCDRASGPGVTTCPATACSNTACVAPLANDNTKTSTACPYCCVSSGVGPGTGSGGACPTGYTKVSGVCFPGGTGLSDKSVLQVLTTLISWLLAIFGLIAILGFIISGLQYLTSAGDESQAETAKRNMQYAIIGVIVALSGWIVIQAVDRLLNANPLI